MKSQQARQLATTVHRASDLSACSMWSMNVRLSFSLSRYTCVVRAWACVVTNKAMQKATDSSLDAQYMLQTNHLVEETLE